MTGPDVAALAAQQELGDTPIPKIVFDIAAGRADELAWRNELGGLTFRLGDEFVKWNPRSTAVDLRREYVRLDWMHGRHPVPRVVMFDADDHAQWIVTEAMGGGCAVGDKWRARSREAIKAIATGLRQIHAIPIDEFPQSWTAETWVGRTPPNLGARPPMDAPVLVHGDACAPNTLIADTGEWVGNVDLGDLSVGDRWADLAIASMSLDWNFGTGHQPEFFDAYGIEPDEQKINYYRALWHQES